MSVQTSYRFHTPMGAAGGIVDLAPYAIDAFLNEENTGVMKFGMAVVKSATKPGVCVRVPVSNSAAADFEGISTNKRTAEFDLDGVVQIRKSATVGVMRYGRVYARVATGITPAYGDNLYMVTSGDDAGCFTNASGDDAVQVKGRFLSGVDATNGVAMVELFNQAQA